MGKGIKRWMNRLDAGFMLCCCLWTKKLLQLLLCHCALCVSETSRFFHFASGVKIRNVNLDSHRMLSITRSTSSIIFVFTALSLPPLEYSSLRFSRITTGKRGKTNHQKLEKKNFIKAYKSILPGPTETGKRQWSIESVQHVWASAVWRRITFEDVCFCNWFLRYFCDKVLTLKDPFSRLRSMTSKLSMHEKKGASDFCTFPLLKCSGNDASKQVSRKRLLTLSFKNKTSS